MRLFCGNCGKDEQVVMIAGKKLFPKGEDEGAYWVCKCGCYIGCLPNSAVPLGIIPTVKVRNLRLVLHSILGGMYKNLGTKKALYKRLEAALGWSFHADGVNTEKDARIALKVIKDYKYEKAEVKEKEKERAERKLLKRSET